MELSTGITDAAPAEATVARPDGAATDVPSIVAPGPWIAFGSLGLGLALGRLHKFGALDRVPSQLRDAVACIAIAYGGWLIYRANIVFRRTGTAFQPWRPTSAIAAVGVYGRTRNPMYQGFLLLVLGLDVMFRNDWGVLLLMPATMLVHHGAVMREERYLERRFGESYRRYMAAVPRYGWPLIAFAQRRPKP